MIHLKYKSKVNFVKLPLIWTDLCVKLVFENVTAGRNTGCRSVVNWASCSCSFRWLIQMRSAAFTSHQPPAGSISAVHMKACMGIKKFPLLRNRSKSDPCMNFLLRITHTIISQSSADSAWITLYIYIYIYNRSTFDIGVLGYIGIV